MLFAALEVATGRVEQACLPRHRHQEFPRFLKQVAKAYPRRRLHIVVDNYATHKHPKATAWPARNPRTTPHCTPTSGSWLNMVEIFFGIITRQAIRRQLRLGPRTDRGHHEIHRRMERTPRTICLNQGRRNNHRQVAP
jgi:transposase